jgi:RNA polymerase sigma-70 factor (ECF subfamily)
MMGEGPRVDTAQARGRETDGSEVTLRADSSLLERARQGDHTALGMLLSRERDRVLTLCVRLLGERAEAEDAAQEAMLRVALHLHELSCDDRFGGWSWRIAHRICVDRLRKSRRREQLTAGRGTRSTGDREQSILGRMAVRQVLAAMPEDMSEVLILREMEEQTYGEIAARLALPLGTVKSRLNAARKRFRRDYLAAMREEV